MIVAVEHIETAFGGALAAPLRHKAGRRAAACRARSRTISSVAAISKFSGVEISRFSRAMSSSRDMAAILAQMRGDAVGAGRDGDKRRANGIRKRAAPRVAQGRDMIDIDAEPGTLGH